MEKVMGPLYIGDTHVGHDKMVEARHMTDQWEHDLTVLNSAISRVKKRGCIIITGDVFFGSVDTFDKMLARVVKCNFPVWNPTDNLPFFLKCVPGNHDKLKKLLASRYFTIDDIHVHKTARLNGKSYIISHVPVHPDQLKPIGRWDGNIHGHLHSKTLPEPYYNTSYDQYKKAVTIEELIGDVVKPIKA